MVKNEIGHAGTSSRAGLFEWFSGKAKSNKSLTATLAIIAAVVALSIYMAVAGLEKSTSLIVVLFVLVTIGLFCTLGIIFNALDDK